MGLRNLGFQFRLLIFELVQNLLVHLWRNVLALDQRKLAAELLEFRLERGLHRVVLLDQGRATVRRLRILFLGLGRDQLNCLSLLLNLQQRRVQLQLDLLQLSLTFN